MIFIDTRRRGSVQVTPAIQMTAASSGSNGITVADDDDIDFGTGDFFLHWEGSLPDWSPSGSTSQPLARSSTGAGNAGISFNIDETPSGNVLLILRDTSTTITINSTVAVGVIDGAIAKITASIIRETASAAGSVVFYVNGAQLGDPVAISAGVPVSVSSSGSLYISGSSTQRTASNTVSFICGNFAPTASEVLDLCTNGVPESLKWGSQAASYTSNFSAGVDGFAATGGAAAGNIDSIGGQDDWLRLTVNSANTTHRLIKTGLFVAGYKYLVSGLMYVPSTNSNLDGAAFGDTSNSTAITTVYAPALDTIVPWYGYFTAGATDFRVAATDGGNGTFQDAGGNDVLYIKTTSVYRVGATMALLPNSIPTSASDKWDDSSGNTGGGTLPADGATKVTIRK